MHKTTLLLATLVGTALSPALQAQLQLFPKSKSDIGVFADDGTKAAVQFFAKTQGVKQDEIREVSSGGAQAGFFLRPFLFSRGFRFQQHGRVLSGSAATARAGTTASTNASSLVAGPQVFELSIRGQATTNLVLTIAGRVTGQGRAKVDVDIDADNKIEWTHTVNGKALRTVIPGFKGGTPRLVRVTIDALATGPGSSYEFTMLAALERSLIGRCHYSRIGLPCGSMVLDGIDSAQATLHDFTFNALGGVPSSPAVLFLGAVRTSIPVPNAGCPLLTLPIFLATPVVADTNGDAQFKFRVPKPLVVRDTLWQVAMFRPAGALVLSSGVQLDCF